MIVSRRNRRNEGDTEGMKVKEDSYTKVTKNHEDNEDGRRLYNVSDIDNQRAG